MIHNVNTCTNLWSVIWCETNTSSHQRITVTIYLVVKYGILFVGHVKLTCWQSCRCKGLLQTFHFDTKICKTNHTREKFRHMHLLGFCFSISKFLYLVLWQQSQKYVFGNQWEWIYSCFYKYLMKLYFLNFSLFLYIFVTGKSCEKWYKSQIWQ